MKTMLMAVISMSLLGLSACATTSETASRAPARDLQETRMSNDEAYMAQVEAIARRRGIDLTWVNPPRTIVAKDE